MISSYATSLSLPLSHVLTRLDGLYGNAAPLADLLAAGSYCWAYPDSTILYHGLRTPADRILTIEETLQLAERLKAGNAGYASDLAQRAGIRAMFRFIMVRDGFDELRPARIAALGEGRH